MADSRNSSLVSIVTLGLGASIAGFLVLTWMGLGIGKALLLAWLSSAVIIPALAYVMTKLAENWRWSAPSEDFHANDQSVER